jgi:hypothetical protein
MWAMETLKMRIAGMNAEILYTGDKESLHSCQQYA